MNKLSDIKEFHMVKVTSYRLRFDGEASAKAAKLCGRGRNGGTSRRLVGTVYLQKMTVCTQRIKTLTSR